MVPNTASTSSHRSAVAGSIVTSTNEGLPGGPTVISVRYMDIELEPEKAGFEPARLDRIDRHFARYVDDGRLAGWQLAVTRRGEVVHPVDVRPARPGGRRSRSSPTRSGASTR